MVETPAFIRAELVEERPPPVMSVGIPGWMRAHLFSGPINTIITIVSIAIFLLVAIPALRFLIFDAVWQGGDRESCLAKVPGDVVGACWPFVKAKFGQFVYGFYPEVQRWRPDVVFILGALLLAPLLIPSAPFKRLNAVLFFVAYPCVAFFLLYGGGMQGFAVAWVADFGRSISRTLVEGGTRLEEISATLLPGISHLLKAVGFAVYMLGAIVSFLFAPLVWLRQTIATSTAPFWIDFLISAVLITLLVFLWTGRLRNGSRTLIISLIAFVAIALVIAIMGLDRGGLPVVETRQWGGLLVTLVVSITGIVVSIPIGVLLALGRRSRMPFVRVAAIAFVEFWRGVPLITVLFFATYMLPLFMPGNFTIDGLTRVLVGIALFSGAYNSEVIRAGLQALPRGQGEASVALGLNKTQTMRFILLPQAFRNIIPSLVNSFIALFKDTTLVLIVSILDLLGQLRAAFSDPNWSTPNTLFTGFAFAGIIYFVFCFGMSRYSLFVEHRLNAHQRR